jgi:hypothetical protein
MYSPIINKETTMQIGQLATAADAKGFMLAGKATFTIRSKATQNRFTYKVKKVPNALDLFFVSVMSGSDNERSYSYMGLLRNGAFSLTAKSRVDASAPSYKAFAWFWANMRQNKLPETVECWHEGRCGRCNRKLTVPESIAKGIGPECSKR